MAQVEWIVENKTLVKKSLDMTTTVDRVALRGKKREAAANVARQCHRIRVNAQASSAGLGCAGSWPERAPDFRRHSCSFRGQQ